MKRSIMIVLLLVVAALIVFAGARQVLKTRAELPKSIGQLQEEKGIPVEVTEAKRGTFTLSHTYLGTIEGLEQGDVISYIMEKIVALPVKVGDYVQKGEIVCRLDNKAAQAQYHQLQLAYKDAVREAQRMKDLYESGAVSKQMLEKAELNRDITQRNLESSSEVVALTAPISGTVADIFYHVGETATPGEPLVRIADMKRVRIRFSANFDDWKKISAATSVFLRYSGNGVVEIPGKIVEISRSADPENRLFTIWVEAENPDHVLQPGLMVDVRVVVIEKPDVILIPRNALLTRNEKQGTFLVNSERRAVFTPLIIGSTNPDEVEVLQGAEPGQLIVVFGQNLLNDGQLVNIIES
ncbi:MAG: efflux RND transporter periplasmic adaptor subunit [bacterium]